jgi:hypothetical protein
LDGFGKIIWNKQIFFSPVLTPHINVTKIVKKNLHTVHIFANLLIVKCLTKFSIVVVNFVEKFFVTTSSFFLIYCILPYNSIKKYEFLANNCLKKIETIHRHLLQNAALLMTQMTHYFFAKPPPTPLLYKNCTEIMQKSLKIASTNNLCL